MNKNGTLEILINELRSESCELGTADWRHLPKQQKQQKQATTSAAAKNNNEVIFIEILKCLK